MIEAGSKDTWRAADKELGTEGRKMTLERDTDSTLEFYGVENMLILLHSQILIL